MPQPCPLRGCDPDSEERMELCMSNRVVTVVLVVAAIFILVADISIWAWMNVVDNDRFVEVASETMEREDVRFAVATIIVDRMFENRPLSA
jgi:hypothetical protein